MFIAWLLATVLCQAPSRVQNWLRKGDVFALIPRWHFFAPTPGTQDFALVYRDQRPNGSLSRWREAPTVPVTRPPLCAVWNPGRRHTKALLDITKELMEVVGSGRQNREIELSVPYLSLLTYVSGLPRFETGCLTQFAIVMSMSSAVEGGPQVVFVSALHEAD